MVEIVKTKVRCPRCKSKDLFLIETGSWSSEFTVIAGSFDRSEGIHNPESIDRLEAKCSACKHLWKVRGAIQIDDAVALSRAQRGVE